MVSFDWEPNFRGLVKHVLDDPRRGHERLPTVLLVGAIARTINRAQLPPDIRSRLILLGEIDHAGKQAAFTAADVAILPITAGRGSNLKTAEALLSHLPIVATRSAFRGFEPLMNEPGVEVVDDTDYAGFQNAIAKLTASCREPPGRRSERVDALCTWAGQTERFLPQFEAWLEPHSVGRAARSDRDCDDGCCPLMAPGTA
ncbi:glycosyltransferase family 4 protein [Lichenihabitans psoromatis]|uniref:glycosyltransferase family 4 protein n=1 Tax=Lichenihabitans psoromatis TaxID=2528642 RepID=UPI0010368E3A|nr:glycosyltransferase family 4 protein [Lichenihabitans psoromatis]